jgi:hypothetical protein
MNPGVDLTRIRLRCDTCLCFFGPAVRIVGDVCEHVNAYPTKAQKRLGVLTSDVPCKGRVLYWQGGPLIGNWVGDESMDEPFTPTDRGYCNACGVEYRGLAVLGDGFCSRCEAARVVNLADVPLEKMMQREPIVKIFKDYENNGHFAMATTASDAGEFLREVAIEIACLETMNGDAEFTLDALLPQVCAVWAKLNGYKAEGVHERRVLIVGEPNPESHMTWMNEPPKPQPVETAA